MLDLYFVGDIHGEYRKLLYLIKNKRIENADMILCGDIGIGFHKHNYYINIFNYLNPKLEERNITLYFVRGNHDDPSYWKEQKLHYSNIILVEDYTVLNLSKNILCIGGANSTDRMLRKKDVDWWEDESIVYDIELVKDLKNIDIVVTHSSPNITEPFINGSYYLTACEKDENLNKDIMYERQYLTDIFDYLKENNDIKNWYYGHYHDSKIHNYGNCNFRMLDIDEIYLQY